MVWCGVWCGHTQYIVMQSTPPPSYSRIFTQFVSLLHISYYALHPYKHTHYPLTQLSFPCPYVYPITNTHEKLLNTHEYELNTTKVSKFPSLIVLFT